MSEGLQLFTQIAHAACSDEHEKKRKKKEKTKNNKQKKQNYFFKTFFPQKRFKSNFQK